MSNLKELIAAVQKQVMTTVEPAEFLIMNPRRRTFWTGEESAFLVDLDFAKGFKTEEAAEEALANIEADFETKVVQAMDVCAYGYHVKDAETITPVYTSKKVLKGKNHDDFFVNILDAFEFANNYELRGKLTAMEEIEKLNAKISKLKKSIA